MIIHDVEQNSEEWLAIRSGIPTASEFKKLVTTKGVRSKTLDTYCLTLAAEVFSGGDLDGWEGNYHTDRGHGLEPEAIESYEFINDCSVEKVGFVTNDEKTAGCSPDGVVGDEGLLEIKCLKAENHVKNILNYKVTGRCPSDYIQQVQGQMFVCERDWCDLFFYHPKLPALIIRVNKDDDFHASLNTHIAEVLQLRDSTLKKLNEM